MIGESGVGKTAIMKQYVNGEFSQFYKSTVGADFFTKDLEIDDKIYTLQLWDTAGHERFRNITTSYYRGAHCIIIVYDITNLETFDHVPEWYQNVQKYARSHTQVLLVGTKSDSAKKRQVSSEAAENLANQLGIIVFEVI